MGRLENYEKFKERYKKEISKFTFEEFDFYFGARLYFNSQRLYKDDMFYRSLLEMVRNIANYLADYYMNLNKGNVSFFKKEAFLEEIEEDIGEKVLKAEKIKLGCYEIEKKLAIEEEKVDIDKLLEMMNGVKELIDYKDEKLGAYLEKISDLSSVSEDKGISENIYG